MRAGDGLRAQSDVACEEGHRRGPQQHQAGIQRLKAAGEMLRRGSAGDIDASIVLFYDSVAPEICRRNRGFLREATGNRPNAPSAVMASAVRSRRMAERGGLK